MHAGKKVIGVIGLWHLGEVYAACLAELGHTVIGFSENEALIHDFQKDVPPLPEPEISELLSKNRQMGRLSFTTDFSLLNTCDVVWLTEDIPTNEHDEADISGILYTVRMIAHHVKQGVTIAVSSQIPVGTSARVIELLSSERPKIRFEYFYAPENLRLGTAVESFMKPERIVVGANTPSALATASQVFAALAVSIVPMSIVSAELTKQALNAWLATSIGFANDLADVCERIGADVEDVIKALKSEPRVGRKAYLFAGLGFAGWTIARDMKALLRIGEEKHISLPLIEAAYEKNRSRTQLVLKRLQERGEVRGKMFTIFGITYKAGTPTLKHSQSLEIEKHLRKAGAQVRLYDPLANAVEVAQITPSPFFHDPYEAAEGADGVLILVADYALLKLDLGKLASRMHTPYLFDAQNVLVSKEQEAHAAGITYSSIGR